MTPARAWIWLTVFGAAGVALAFLYPDCYQQDGGHHYLFARVAWRHPEILVKVWPRPLFTLIYSLPAQLGYSAAKLFGLVVCLVTAHQTVRLAQELRLDRPALIIPILFLQPAYALLAADTMTEPLFALVVVLALRLYANGRVVASAIAASLMILVRPEGFFLGALWAVWILSRGGWRGVAHNLPRALLVASGAVLWWLAALVLTGDPLFIPHDWPRGWEATAAANGIGNVTTYAAKLPEIAGPLLCVPFLIGLIALLVRRRLGTLTSAFLTVFVVHSVLRAFGLFGSAGYARYFVCVSPVIALITLAGWNVVAGWFTWVPGVIRTVTVTAVFVVSAAVVVLYVDAQKFSRDAHAIAEMYSWFRAHPRPVDRVIWSQAYMGILFDDDVWEKPGLVGGKAENLEVLRHSPGRTLVFWDADTGPSWFAITADDLEAAGYERLRSQQYELSGRLGLSRRWHFYDWFYDWGPRPQQMHLFYKSR